MDQATFEKWHVGDVQMIRIVGVLDFAAAVQLRLALYGCLDADARRVVVDLSTVRLVDAGSINVLLAVHDRLTHRGGGLVVTGAKKLVLQALELTGAAKTLGVYGSPEPVPAGPEAETLHVEAGWGNDINDLIGRMHEQETPAARTALRDRVLRECLPHAERLAHRFYRLGEPAEDLNQVAAVALIGALDRFDPTAGTDFAAYATRTVVGALKRYFRDHGWAVRPPRQIQEMRLAVNRARGDLAQTLNRIPDTADIAAHLGAGADRVDEALVAAQGYRPTSLEAPVGDDPDAAVLLDRIGVDEVGYSHVVDRELLGSVLTDLPDRERRIIMMRFHGGMSQREIAAEIGISQMHVSRLLTRSLNRLRQTIEATGAV